MSRRRKLKNVRGGSVSVDTNKYAFYAAIINAAAPLMPGYVAPQPVTINIHPQGVGEKCGCNCSACAGCKGRDGENDGA